MNELNNNVNNNFNDVENPNGKKKKSYTWLIVLIIVLLLIPVIFIVCMAIIYIGFNKRVSDATFMIRVPYAMVEIESGGKINDNLIGYREVKKSELDYDVVIDSSEIIGLCVKEDIRKEEYFLEDNLEECPAEESLISDELRNDLDKKAELSKRLAINIIYDSRLFNSGYKNVISENTDSIYANLAYATYEYYIYKTGNKRETYTTDDSSLATCYSQANVGYCYVSDKSDILIYEKQFYNMGEKIFDLGDWASIRGDKIFVNSVPGNNISIETISVVSVTMIEDKSISYVVSYKVGFGSDIENVNVNYTFKLNENKDYYLYSVNKA